MSTEFAGVTIIFRSSTNTKPTGGSDAAGKPGAQGGRRKSEIPSSLLPVQFRSDHGERGETTGASIGLFERRCITSMRTLLGQHVPLGVSRSEHSFHPSQNPKQWRQYTFTESWFRILFICSLSKVFLSFCWSNKTTAIAFACWDLVPIYEWRPEGQQWYCSRRNGRTPCPRSAFDLNLDLGEKVNSGITPTLQSFRASSSNSLYHKSLSFIKYLFWQSILTSLTAHLIR